MTPLRVLLLAGLTLGLMALPGRGRAEGAPGACADPASTPYAEVQIESVPRLALEIAGTPREHQVGLMNRPSLPPDAGMLFVYDRPATEGYWMHDTYVPLSIAWIDQYGTIVDIQDMQPLTDAIHVPAAAYWYALEVNQGWFLEHGVGVGQQVLFCLGG